MALERVRVMRGNCLLYRYPINQLINLIEKISFARAAVTSKSGKLITKLQSIDRKHELYHLPAFYRLLPRKGLQIKNSFRLTTREQAPEISSVKLELVLDQA